MHTSAVLARWDCLTRSVYHSAFGARPGGAHGPHLPFLDDHVDTSQSGDIAKALHEARDLDGMAHEMRFYFEQKGVAIEVATCAGHVTRTLAAVNSLDLLCLLRFTWDRRIGHRAQGSV